MTNSQGNKDVKHTTSLGDQPGHQAQARIPTPYGEFQLHLFRVGDHAEEHLALVMGAVSGLAGVLVRVHSECFTGDVLGSLRCDCGEQLQRALRTIARAGQGVLVYLRQEGRGIGLLDKLRAYNLQDAGYDTVEANLLLGHPADGRDYTAAHLILQALGVESVRLLTNNPAKVESLARLGTRVIERVPLLPQVQAENARYLQTKRERLHHWLEPASASAETRPPTTGRPQVTLSYAQSLDGSLARQRGAPLPLSGPEALVMTHQLRADHDAILVGIGTVLADDPALTVRLVRGQNPQIVVLDSHLRCPPTARILAGHPWLCATETAAVDRQARLEAAGAVVLRFAADPAGRVHLPSALARLVQHGVQQLMVEGGAAVISSFLAAQAVDRLVITVAPQLVGGLPAISELPAMPRLRALRYEPLGEDWVVGGEVVWAEAEEVGDEAIGK